MSDIVERAEAALGSVRVSLNDIIGSSALIQDLVTELKAARAEVQQRREQAEMWEAAVKRARAEDYQWRKDISKELLELRERLRVHLHG